MNTIYDHDGIIIIHADCCDVLPQFPAASVDLILTDPPYGIKYHSNHYIGANPHAEIINDDIFFLPIELLVPLLKPTGVMMYFYSYKNRVEYSGVKNEIIWLKDNWTAGDLEGDLGNQYETIAFCPQTKFKLKGYRHSNVWYCPRVPTHKLLHPSEKPIALLERAIRMATTKGDTVLDPFVGSGSCAVAALRSDRRFIGIDIELKYCNVTADRVRAARQGLEIAHYNTKQNPLFKGG